MSCDGSQEVEIALCRHPSAVGPLWVAASPKGAVRVAFAETPLDELVADLVRRFGALQIVRTSRPRGLLAEVVGHLDRALAGESARRCPLDLAVSQFERAVLDEVAAIPWGQVRSYAEVAEAVGRPRAHRAVGRACAANPVPILVPCHRVVGSRGELLGFSAGIERKAALLAREGVLLT